MVKEKLYLSGMDEKAHILARKYGLGLEITDFSIPWNLDTEREQTDRNVQEKVRYTDRCLLHGPYSELFPSAVDPLVRQVAEHRFLQTMEAARQYGAAKVILHGGFNGKLFFFYWFLEQSVKFWREFAPKIPEGITVCIENVLETEPEMLTDIVRQVDAPNIRICLDVGHANAYSHVSPMEWVERCGKLISHFHLHNNDGTSDAHGPLFQGSIPMAQLLARIEDTCSDATATLEIDGADTSVRWLIDQNILEE